MDSCTRWRNPASIPLSRTCRFMLTEEAHHMFVGETGISPHRAAHCERCGKPASAIPRIAKVRALGVVDLPTMPEKLNLHYSLSLDLFAVSTNAATPSMPASRAATRNADR